MIALAWFVAASILISHFRFYYGVGWHDATKWGVGDGLIWALLLYTFVYARMRFSTCFQSWREESVYLGLAVLSGVFVHPTLSSLLFWAIDGSISRPFIEDVLHLAMKRLPQGILAGGMIGFAGVSAAIAQASRTKSERAAPSESKPQATVAPWLALKDANGVRRVNIADIRYVEAAGNYVALRTADAERLERTTLKAMESQLQDRRFRRISRKHLVNLDHVSSIESTKPKGGVAVLKSGEALPVSRQYKTILQEEFASYLQYQKAALDLEP